MNFRKIFSTFRILFVKIGIPIQFMMSSYFDWGKEQEVRLVVYACNYLVRFKVGIHNLTIICCNVFSVNKGMFSKQ